MANYAAQNCSTNGTLSQFSYILFGSGKLVLVKQKVRNLYFIITYTDYTPIHSYTDLSIKILL
jgi:hypothetical protein